MQGVLPVMLPSNLPCIVIFCLTQSAGLCSCQQEAFEVHLYQVGTKSDSNQRRFRFRAHLFDHMNSFLGFQASTEAHVDAKLAEIAFHRTTVES